jgi:hypothetical protein
MKTMFLALMLLLCATAAATEPLMSVDPSADAKQMQAQSSGYNCFAYTACQYGGTIACHVYGVSSTSSMCTWWVIPYRAVGCTGADAYGVWQSYTFYCP